MKQVDSFSLSLVEFEQGVTPRAHGEESYYQVVGTKLRDMGESLMNTAAVEGWDVLSLMDAGYSHSLLSLRHKLGEELKAKHWLVLGLTEEAPEDKV